ncbi:hypothetical protein DSO57_1001597 [Entomophthora muscae]|uniref:Uncharacterized protein n=1 Tax=Entomophthora muscae TaxID=34485 RepID=A0ACC2SAU6_9FUNG|nr:hypothetical protein DSO57_1001597 [Entomophthora muscae]
MEPPSTPKPLISTPPTSNTTGQSIQFLGVLYLALTGLIESALPVTGPWAVAGKALSYLVKLGPIIWWAMPVPASTPPSPEEASQYPWYPGKENLLAKMVVNEVTIMYTINTQQNTLACTVRMGDRLVGNKT